MEPPPPSRQRAATAWTAGSPGLRDKAALQFAEKRQYRELLHAIQLRPELSAQCDDFGMTPLHWVCTDRAAPLRVLQQLVLAYPTATTMRSLAGLLPLHMAVRKDLSLDALKTVLKFYPKAVVAETPEGSTPVEIAKRHLTSHAAKTFLVQLEEEVRSLSRVPASQTSVSTVTSTLTSGTSSSGRSKASAKSTEVIRGWEDGYPVAILGDSPPHSSSQRSQDEMARATWPLPPVWKLNKTCHICDVKFGYFKNRHHCRNCGESVCGRHSKHSVPLKHLGLFHPQRVCTGCFSRLQSHYTSRAIARLSPHSASSDVMSARYEDTLPMEHAFSPPRMRQMRSQSAYTITSPAEQRHPMLSPRRHQLPTTPSSPALVTPPLPPTRTNRSATLSPRSCRTASSTNTVRSAASTASTTSPAYQSNFIKLPSGMSMHITHVQRTDDKLTVLERQREMQRRRDRLAHTDIDTYALNSPRDWHTRASEDSRPLSNQDSNEDNELLLEIQMQKLLVAKKKISDALERSKRDADHAQADKFKYDGLAKEYEQRGYEYASGRGEAPPAAAGGADAAESDLVDVCSVVATRSFAASEDNQLDHEAESDSMHKTYAKYSTEDDDDAAVYALVPETTPGETVRTDSLFKAEEVDMPLDLARTYHDLGVALLTKGDFANAVAELQKSLDLDQTNAQTWYHFAKALDGKGESAVAERAILKSLDIEPNSLPGLSLLGKLLNSRGEHDEAIVVFRRALNLQCPSESHPSAYNAVSSMVA